VTPPTRFIDSTLQRAQLKSTIQHKCPEGIFHFTFCFLRFKLVRYNALPTRQLSPFRCNAATRTRKSLLLRRQWRPAPSGSNAEQAIAGGQARTTAATGTMDVPGFPGFVSDKVTTSPNDRDDQTMMLSEQEIYAIRDRIAGQLHPEKIVLFGSYAENRATADSDIDLLVIMPTELDKLQRSLTVKRLFRNRSFSLDAFVFTPEEFELLREVKGSLVHKAMQAGRVLYEH
jgi:predicted nucleotidyltransferase